MAGFFKGNLQDGIGLAMREAKAVVCFVRDDGHASSTWEEEYLVGENVTPALDTNAILLRIIAGSQEAGFLTSFCPIAKFPTVVVIKNGTLQEYLAPETSKDDFQSRLVGAVDPQDHPKHTQKSDSNTSAARDKSAEISDSSATPTSNSSATRDTNSLPASATSTASAASLKSCIEKSPPGQSSKLSAQKPVPANLMSPGDTRKRSVASQKGTEKPEEERQKPQSPKVNNTPAPLPKDRDLKPKEAPGNPTQYRLQVRLFDGSSIRSSFSPSQTIRSDVRSWLDQKMGTEQRPYNLKHILTPLPSRTLSISEESQTLQDLGLGSTANLVMVPVSSYTDAYSISGSSLPARGVSAVYSVVSSAITTATGLLGSLTGHGTPTTSEVESSTAPGQSGSSRATQRPGIRGPNIRTLGDQGSNEDDRQFYNGNQLNFEPREEDRKDH
ncbi:hypothetical protein N7478_001579 [Penicillium angulare]|uniref:uncharacterized protein n=1 Tax=Penicillium angulare TaxID=116970 RepID=UPI002540D520|nr:uncharacterized protein N7478_001579 [Penicillium angulare]KAJ5288549.1 hypothetical protein N7478_001579 [Penicillium angulare]